MNADWLKQLAPPHAPSGVGWWPPAPGWWVVALLFLLFSAVLIYRRQHMPARLYRAALRELRQLETHSDDVQLASELQNLLRRYAIAVYGRETVAGLSGAAWLAFVATHGGNELAGETGQRLLDVAYGNHEQTIDRARCLQGALGFLRGWP